MRSDSQRKSDKVRRERRKEIVKQAKSKPCTDCGKVFPYYVMDLDHLGDKNFGIGDHRVWVSETLLREEIAKCEPVCANCHRKRTFMRARSRGSK